ncbi:MAG TPA: phosphatidate cytidylyltransferase [Methylophilaceae bacterium]|jgi:phosphatidate cytidylyltransferase
MLKTRIFTSVILIFGFLAALFYLPDTYWAILMLGGLLIGTREWAVMAKFRPVVNIAYLSITLLAGLALIFAPQLNMSYLQHYGMFWGILAAAIFWILVAPVWLVSRYQFKNFLVMAVAGWVVIMPLWLALLSLRRISPWLLLGIIGAVWIADSAAYFTGKRFGKRKLAPLISPGKTWEGVLGAWLAVSIYGFVLCQVFALDYWLIAGLWGITVLSIMGDLLESLLKRQANLKDSGSLLPGHGGVLDRIDGLTSSLPLAAFFIYFPLYYAAWFYYV